jgi:hypothetical protein
VKRCGGNTVDGLANLCLGEIVFNLDGVRRETGARDFDSRLEAACSGCSAHEGPSGRASVRPPSRVIVSVKMGLPNLSTGVKGWVAV